MRGDTNIFTFFIPSFFPPDRFTAPRWRMMESKTQQRENEKEIEQKNVKLKKSFNQTQSIFPLFSCVVLVSGKFSHSDVEESFSFYSSQLFSDFVLFAGNYGI